MILSYSKLNQWSYHTQKNLIEQIFIQYSQTKHENPRHFTCKPKTKRPEECVHWWRLIWEKEGMHLRGLEGDVYVVFLKEFWCETEWL